MEYRGELMRRREGLRREAEHAREAKAEAESRGIEYTADEAAYQLFFSIRRKEDSVREEWW